MQYLITGIRDQKKKKKKKDCCIREQPVSVSFYELRIPNLYCVIGNYPIRFSNLGSEPNLLYLLNAAVFIHYFSSWRRCFHLQVYGTFVNCFGEWEVVPGATLANIVVYWIWHIQLGTSISFYSTIKMPLVYHYLLHFHIKSSFFCIESVNLQQLIFLLQ